MKRLALALFLVFMNAGPVGAGWHGVAGTGPNESPAGSFDANDRGFLGRPRALRRCRAAL